MKLNSSIPKQVMAVILLFITLTVHGQTEKGRITIGGSSELSFTNGKQNYTMAGEPSGDIRFREFNFSPYGGYFIMKDLLLSFQVMLKASKTTTVYSNGNTAESRTSAMSLGPNICYYLPVGTQLRPYVQAGVVYAWSGTGDDTNKFSGFTMGGILGGAYFINKQAAVELGLRYAHSALKNKANKDLRYKENLFAPIIGLSFYF
ncbi:porin family protein [Niabella sp. CC-SYL272]|uniref:outer membrane beta-barrel protein n=1 Tax=Niabella agricola TaxID=2891571 RepID=UPI001F3BD01A|nr:outer membrane beta-barrel protein [Niabella agricola]MCF3111531.1 porin family protein [Niabella agricola]